MALLASGIKELPGLSRRNLNTYRLVETKKDGTPRYVFEKTIHDFRRTATRNLSRAGVRRDVAKAITGHVTDVMYTRYNITDEDDLREGMEKV